MIHRLKAVDLFAGIGGIRLGFERAGFKIAYSNEIDRYCCQTYRTNFGDIDQRDIKDVPSSEIPDFDILLAGFPCQPFSLAGGKKGFEDPRGNLFFQIERILTDKIPKAFFLENVKFLERHHRGETFGVIKDILVNKLGYHIFYKVINSKDFGLPQNRERIYIVGFSKKVNFDFPEPTGEKLKVGDILEKEEADVKYFISQRYYECLARHKAYHRAKGHGWGYEVVDLNGTANSLVVGRMGRERNLIKEPIREYFYREGMNKSAKNCLGLRTLTPRECARLQGFPEDYKIPVSDNQAYKQFGNTVSVPVVEAIARRIIRFLKPSKKQIKAESIESPVIDDFAYRFA
jgi:DNA (cytosine-5)-methyltransferase 1